MAVPRDRPYVQCNFLVDIGTGETLGFSEVLMPAASVAVVEYREGADKTSEARKLMGRAHTEDVVLRRGVAGRLDLYEWWNDVRNGDVDARRTVRILLLSEEASPVMTWTLLRAWPTRIAYGPLRGLGEEIAVESLTLAYERLELE